MIKIEKEILAPQVNFSNRNEGFFLLRENKKKLFPIETLQSQERYVLKIEINEVEVAFIDFVNLTKEEQLIVWHWRNNENIRQWMYQPEPFSLEEHLSFIRGLGRKQDRQYFLVKNQQGYLGVIDFVNIDFQNRSCEFGLYANPDATQPGVGRLLDSIAIVYAFQILEMDVLRLEVFKENVQVVNLHKKFKFSVCGHRIVNNKQVLFMQLKRTEM